jgi:large subunit ribosomal protein L31e
MAEEIERIYTIPLRDAYYKAPRPKRAKRAVSEIRHYLARHLKAEEEKIWLDNPVNEAIWARGIQKPPRRIRVKAIKFEDGVVEVSLPEEQSSA